MGTDEPSSIPTVLINTGEVLNETQQKGLQEKIWSALFDAPHSIQIAFRQSRLRRSHGSSDPPICQPRNTGFSKTPGTGASIGIAGSLVDTATLGCYLLVDKKPMVLTVDHLITESNETVLAITHVSEQDRADLLASFIHCFLSGYTFPPDHPRCTVCAVLPNWPRDLQSGLLERYVSSDRLLECPLYREINSKFISEETSICQALPFARSYAQSGRRARDPIFQSTTDPGGLPREMDWALFEVLNDTKIGPGHHILPQLRHGHPWEGNYLHAANVRPGAFVRSLGRTSGHQLGQISTTAGVIFHEEYQTLEWSVVRRPETSIRDWVEGGIGVDGDSGGLIVDESTNAVYGMLWGRSGEGPQTFTIFTPLKEILLDIQERTHVSVELLWGQKWPKPDTKRPRESTTLPPAVEIVPITMSTGESGHTNTIDLDIPTPGVRRLSSIEVDHRPFERYRGHDHRHHSMPRGMVASKDEETASQSQYPGSWTYTRQALKAEHED